MEPRFEQLLLDYGQANHADERRKVQDELWKEFGCRKAVLVMDMSGFSRLTQKYGVVHYLSMVKRMQITTQPIIEQHGGQVVKFEADNCFAMFEHVHSAVQASIALNTAFDAMNRVTQNDFDIRVAIGIDYGDVLLVGGPDYFGHAVNRASKLGEDVAGPGEIIITQDAFAQIPKEMGIPGKPVTFTVSGIELSAVIIEETSPR